MVGEKKGAGKKGRFDQNGHTSSSEKKKRMTTFLCLFVAHSLHCFHTSSFATTHGEHVRKTAHCSAIRIRIDSTKMLMRMLQQRWKCYDHRTSNSLATLGTLTTILILLLSFTHTVESSSTASTAAALSPSGSSSTTVTKFLQNEITSIATAHNSINSFLRDRKIPIGDVPGSLRTTTNSDKIGGAGKKLIVALSEKSNNIECRVALERAPIGSKCIAPCGCSGSQKWIQFSVLNRMRRTDPGQWRVCQTCQQQFDYSGFLAYGGELGNVISLVLDNPVILRSTLGGVAAIVMWEGTVGRLSMRLLMSRFFWNLHTKWSRIVHLPLVLKFWGGKVLLQYLWDKYAIIEKVIAKSLTEVESSIIEKGLPVTVTSAD